MWWVGVPSVRAPWPAPAASGIRADRVLIAVEISSRARLDPIASNTRQSKQTLAQVILAVGRYESITLLPGKESRTDGQYSNSARYF